ncbi:OmpA family protein [Fodinibius salsisoli]|uniref:OmpA family protein n=1 Tax=Fodinibius salsisoli TaxID=2820877 RepID=A0ABT3PRX6_9BACT|nr:OmpA family protein [Fodinibius salsisoli]MCW9708613.1 OmpA family protein [Fodinibius salsisoli]
MKKMIPVVLALLFVTGIQSVQAQTAEQPLGFKVLFGTQGYDGDLGNELTDFASYDHLYGVGFAAYLNSYFDLSLDARLMTFDVENGPDDAYFERRNSLFETDNLNFNLMLRLKPWAGRSRLDPYAAAGLGFNFLQDNSGVRNDESQFAFGIPLGIGVNYKINETILLNVQGTYNRTFSDDIDNYPLAAGEAAPTLSDEEVNAHIDFDGKDHDDFFTTSIGLVFNFGGGETMDDDERLLRQSLENLEAAEGSSNEAAKTLRQAQKLNDETLAALDELRDAIDQMPEESENLKAEMVRIVNNIQFEFDKDEIISPAYDELNSLAAIIQEYKGLSIDIAARADDRGTQSYNDELSMRRAQAVKDYLINQGVDASRITTSALGETDPLMQGRSQTAHAQNRSVQLTLSYKSPM